MKMLKIFILLVNLCLINTANAAVKISHWQTSSGSNVYFVENHDLPIIDVAVNFPAGSARDTKATSGAAGVTRYMMTLGADGMNEEVITNKFADIGAILGGELDADRAAFKLRTLTSESAKALQTFNQILHKPDFPQTVLEREKTRIIAGLKESATQPESISSKAFMQALYPNHPYGLYESGEIDTITAMKRDDLVAFYNTFYSAKSAVITLIGDMTEAQAKAIAEDASKTLFTARGNLKQLTALTNQAQAKYTQAQRELAKANIVLKASVRKYELAVAAVSFTNREIGKLAVNAYVSGGGLSDIEAVLSASGPQEIIDRISTIENLSSGNRTALKRFQVAQAAAQAAQLIADAAKRRQVIVTAEVADAKQEAEAAEAEQQAEVDKLQAVQDKLQRDLASAKNVRISLEQKRQLAILEERRANEASKTKGQSKIWRTGGPTGVSTSRTSEAQRLKAVEFAKRQVLANKPYVWGSEGPSTFDCSGLVYAAYKYAGLGWPSWDRLNSGLYYTYTKQIPLDQMQPGDLIFYSYKGTISTIHHMSIYAGDGMMWEARSTKSGLRFSDIYSVDGMMPYVGRV